VSASAAEVQFNPRRIIEILSAHEVEFVVVGGIGAVLHGSPISTFDLDIVPAMSRSNLDRLVDALKELRAVARAAGEDEGLRLDFTGKSLNKWLVDFSILNLRTRFGDLDLLYRPAGTRGYSDLAAGAQEEQIGEIGVRVAALEDIIRSKQAAARERDLEQLPTLRRLLERKQSPRAPG
jgi:hypothetical protein